MAWTPVGTAGGAQQKTLSATLTVVTTRTVATGEVLFLIVAKDNVGGGGGSSTSVVGASCSAGSFSKFTEFTYNPQSTTAAGATEAILHIRPRVDLPSGSSIDITFSAAVTASAAYTYGFTLSPDSIYDWISNWTDWGGNAADLPAAPISSLLSREYLFLRVSAIESDIFTYGSITPTSGWTAINGDGLGTTGGVANTNMTVWGEYRVLTATAATSDPTMGATADSASTIMPVLETNIGPVVIALIGLGATASRGSLGFTASSSGAATGKQAAGSVGTLADSRSLGLTGQPAASGLGAIDNTAAKTLTGQGVTGAIGSIDNVASRALTGLGSTGARGVLAVGPRSLALTGLAASGAVGTLGVIKDASSTVALIGLGVAGQLGDLTPAQDAVFAALTGVEAAGDAGAIIGELAGDLTGLEAVADDVGSISGEQDHSGLLITGLSAVAGVGSFADMIIDPWTALPPCAEPVWTKLCCGP